MALFQTSVLKKYINSLDESVIEEKSMEYRKYFMDSERQKNIKLINEEQYQQKF